MTHGQDNQGSDGYSRRDFLKKGAAAGLGISVAGAALTSCSQRLTAPPEPLSLIHI